MKKLVYVTGAGRGIGQTIALGLIKSGFEVAGCARSVNELDETKEMSGGKLHINRVDVKDYQSLERWIIGEEKSTGAVPFGLVTAAGVYGPVGPFIENDWQQWKDCVDINLYGSIMACQIFGRRLATLKSPGRIVLLSGGGATKPIENLTGYCATKSAIVRFGETLAKELAPFQITVNSIAPGLVASKLHDEVLKAGPEKAGREAYEAALKQKEGKGQSPEKAAQLVNYLMGDNAGEITGRLISAVWDPWEKMHEWSEQWQKSDVYTLRRIVPEDRSL